MARVDDYRAAHRLAAQQLAREPFAALVARTGLRDGGDRTLRLHFLARHYALHYPTFDFSDTEQAGKMIPLQEQVLILHYLQGADANRPPGQWIAYREIPGAGFYYPAFVKRAINPLKKVFGRNLAAFKRNSTALGGAALEAGDAAYQFQVLPQLPLQLLLWAGDDEFEPEANVLFTSSVGMCLSPEDAAWMAGMLVYRLIALRPD
jgi:hypothetical protein